MLDSELWYEDIVQNCPEPRETVNKHVLEK